MPKNNKKVREPESVLIQNAIAPRRVVRGEQALDASADLLREMGARPYVIGGDRSLQLFQTRIETLFDGDEIQVASYGEDCSEQRIKSLVKEVKAHKSDFVLGLGGGKALDAAKLVAYQSNRPVVTVPTSAATCAAWTALSNVYSEAGAFQYDVALSVAPDLLILDYGIIRSAPVRTLVAGIGDALAKWYEASISSGHSQETLIIAAVQQARVLRDILLQQSETAIADVNSDAWKQVVDASVLMAGVIGGLGGAQCRTVAAHAVHNGLTHLSPTRKSLHGEKVAYGILVQLRLEELLQQSQLAQSSRHQLIRFYQAIGLPCTLGDLGMQDISLADLTQATEVACAPNSDLHHLPFTVSPVQLATAMISTVDSQAAETMPKSSQAQDLLAKVDLGEDNVQRNERPSKSLKG